MKGKEALPSFEAKGHLGKNFLVRQLFYPYMRFRDVTRKCIRLIYFVREGDRFDLFEYSPRGDDYNGLVLVKERSYLLLGERISRETIEKCLREPPLIEDPKVSFPQADNFQRVIDLSELLITKRNQTLDIDEVIDKGGFAVRQANYYMLALVYLGIAIHERGEGRWRLDPSWASYLTNSSIEKKLRFLKAILKHSIFQKAMRLSLRKKEAPTKDEIVSLFVEERIPISGDTLIRRASTVRGWIKWILEAMDCCGRL